MPTQCSADLFGFASVEGRRVDAAFDGGAVTSDAGALLLGATDRAIKLVERFARCFTDARRSDLIEHEVATLIGQRAFAIALGYEDLNDHDELRHDPAMAVLVGKLEAKRSDCAPLAGKSTLNRLELSRPEPTRYHKIAYDAEAIERLFVRLFLEAHRTPPKQIILDLDATDDPLHGHQEGRFFHGYYDCYCYLPLYVFCDRHLLCAKLRRSNIDGSAGAVEEVARIVAQIRASWPRVRILLRADSGFAREALMAWCEQHRVDYVFGLARNARLEAKVAPELAQAKAAAQASGQPARCFKDFLWSTLDSSAARDRQGGVDARRGQPALRGHLAQAEGDRSTPSLRADLLRPGRDGEPDQRMPDRPLCRSDLERDHAGQPAPAVVRLDGVRADLRPAPDRACSHAVRRSDLWHDPAQAAEDRRVGPHLGAADQVRHGLRLPLAA